MKIKIYLDEFRRFADKATEVYEKDGMYKLQEYCVCSGLNLVAIYTIVNEKANSQELADNIERLIEFYNFEVQESK